MKKIIQIVLSVTIVILAFLLYESISKPIRFEAEKKKIYDATIVRLKTIRTAQTAYKDKHGEYAKNFDKLISFIKTDSFDIKKPINLGWDQDEMTQEEAIRAGKLKFEITKVSILDSLFNHKSIVDSMRYVPYSGGYEFEIGATEVLTASKVRVQVFEAKVHNNILLKDLDRQLVINLNDEKRQIERYPGLKVGSLTEANNNAGNWE